MKIIPIGDIFDNLEPRTWLLHGVNSKGAVNGLAAQMAERFPIQYADYRNCCDQKLIFPGAALVHKPSEGGCHVVSLCIKSSPHMQSTGEWITRAYIAFTQLLQNLQPEEVPHCIRIPVIGGGMGAVGADNPLGKSLTHKEATELRLVAVNFIRKLPIQLTKIELAK
jgi:hypothetical protein